MTDSKETKQVNAVIIDSSEIEQTLQIMTWVENNDYFELPEAVDAVKAWDKVGGDKESVDSILDRYHGRFENRDEFLEEYLESRGTIRELKEVTITIPNNGINYLNFDYLDCDYLWDSLFEYKFWGGFYYDESIRNSRAYYYVFYKDG